MLRFVDVTQSISYKELPNYKVEWGDLVKAVVDIEQRVMVL
jgi:hypothetical protein